MKSAQLYPLNSHDKITKLVQHKLHRSASSSGTKSNIASSLSLSHTHTHTPHADSSCMNVLCKYETQTAKCKSNPNPNPNPCPEFDAPGSNPRGLVSMKNDLTPILVKHQIEFWCHATWSSEPRRLTRIRCSRLRFPETSSSKIVQIVQIVQT